MVGFSAVTRRFWILTALFIGAYVALGYWLAENGVVEEWLYRIGLTAAAIIPLVFVLVYTGFGLLADIPGMKWWRTALGSAIVLAALSLVPLTAPLCWVFWFDGGVLHQSWLAWIEVSGPALSALAWLRVCWLWVKVRALQRAFALREGTGPDSHPAGS